MKYLARYEKMNRGSFGFPIELYYIDSAHPRYEMPFHWHFECELILVLQGEFMLSLDGEKILLSTKQSAFIPSSVIHGGTPKNCIYECVVFDMDAFLHYTPLRLETYEKTLHNGLAIENIFEADSTCGKVIDAVFEAMEKEYNGYEFATTGFLWQFIGCVLQHHLYRMMPPTSQEDKRTQQIKQVFRRIRKDFAQPLTLEQLAQEAQLNPHYFCQVFRQLAGRTPIDYLNYYRIECAAEQLCTTSLSITEIALACGFNDISYFNRLFKKHKLMTPTTFRKSHRSV